LRGRPCQTTAVCASPPSTSSAAVREKRGRKGGGLMQHGQRGLLHWATTLGSGGVGPQIGSTLFHWVNAIPFLGSPPHRLVWRRDWLGSDARLAPRPGQRHQDAELPAIFSAIACPRASQKIMHASGHCCANVICAKLLRRHGSRQRDGSRRRHGPRNEGWTQRGIDYVHSAMGYVLGCAKHRSGVVTPRGRAME